MLSIDKKCQPVCLQHTKIILYRQKKSTLRLKNTKDTLYKKENGLTFGGQQICSCQPEQKNLKENVFFLPYWIARKLYSPPLIWNNLSNITG
jgi:hypothetical protein